MFEKLLIKVGFQKYYLVHSWILFHLYQLDKQHSMHVMEFILLLVVSHCWSLILSWRMPLSYRNQFIDLLCKSMNWFLYDRYLCHERVNGWGIVQWNQRKGLIAKGHPPSTISSYEPISGNDPFYTPRKHIKPLVNLWFSVF